MKSKTARSLFRGNGPDETSEDAEAKSFWDAFFMVFNVPRRRVATFEQPVKKSDGHGGYIDLLWKGILLVEHKSRGKDLDRAFKQAKDYFPGLKDRDLPRYILVSDFARFRLYDLEEGEQHEFPSRIFISTFASSASLPATRRLLIRNRTRLTSMPRSRWVCLFQLRAHRQARSICSAGRAAFGRLGSALA
jgi:hypothetical protein